MRIRFQLDLFLDATDTLSQDKIKTVFDALKSRLLRASAVETSSITIQKCYHDETPPKPCETVYSWSKE